LGNFVAGVNVYETEQRLTSYETHVLDVIVGTELRACHAKVAGEINATMPSGRRARHLLLPGKLVEREQHE
jgi:hypothetical protein